MKILVTGGAGYIGSHTCVELLESGHEVVIIDNFINSDYEVINKIQEVSGRSIKFYEGNVGDQRLLEHIFKENSFDAVIHFAGLKAVNESILNPLKYYKENLIETLVLLEVMQMYEVKRLVFSSSATVYGLPEMVPIKEVSPTNPLNPYGRSKLMIEQILEDIYRSDDSWGVTILRYFNPIGAHESGMLGENPKGIPNNLLPYIAKVASGELEFLDIFGDDYKTRDGTGVRDYIHVVDLSQGHIKALEKLMKDNGGLEVFNLGTGTGYSVFEVIKAFEDASGVKIKYKIQKRRSGDVPESYADINKAKQLLGWTSKKNLAQMCNDNWNFIVRNFL